MGITSKQATIITNKKYKLKQPTKGQSAGAKKCLTKQCKCFVSLSLSISAPRSLLCLPTTNKKNFEKNRKKKIKNPQRKEAILKTTEHEKKT